MSRWSLSFLSRGRLRVDLRPGSVTLARKQSFFGSRLQPLQSVAVDQDEAAEPSALWRAGVDALGGMLSRARPSGARVEVVISSHFVRYVLVPWSESLVRDADRLAFARLACREVYGALVDGWEVCLDDPPAGQAAFASAIDRELLAAIQNAVAHVGANLEAVIPALADCINRHRRVLRKRDFCLANVEAGRLTFAFRGNAGWRAVRTRRADGPLPELLPTLLKQEASASGVPEGGRLYLCALRVRDHANILVPGWKVVLLDEAALPAPPMVEPTLISMES